MTFSSSDGEEEDDDEGDEAAISLPTKYASIAMQCMINEVRQSLCVCKGNLERCRHPYWMEPYSWVTSRACGEEYSATKVMMYNWKSFYQPVMHHMMPEHPRTFSRALLAKAEATHFLTSNH